MKVILPLLAVFILLSVNVQAIKINNNIITTDDVVWKIQQDYISKYIDIEIRDINESCFLIKTKPQHKLLEIYTDSYDLKKQDFLNKYKDLDKDATKKGRDAINDIKSIGEMPITNVRGFKLSKIKKKFKDNTFYAFEKNEIVICGKKIKGNGISLGFGTTDITIKDATFLVTIDPATSYCLINCEHEITIYNKDNVSHTLFLDNITIENPSVMNNVKFYYYENESYTQQLAVLDYEDKYYDINNETCKYDNCKPYNDTSCVCNESIVVGYENYITYYTVKKEFDSYEINPDDELKLVLEYDVPKDSSGKYNLTFFINGEYYNIDPWWDSSWNYKVGINVSVPSGSTVSGFQVPISIDTTRLYNEGKIRSDCGDIRFLNGSENSELPYWFEICNTTGLNTTFYVKIDQPITTTPYTIYMYYGNSGATTTKNGTQTFEWYFDGNLYNLFTCDSGCVITNNGGELNIVRSGSTCGCYVNISTVLEYIIEYRVKTKDTTATNDVNYLIFADYDGTNSFTDRAIQIEVALYNNQDALSHSNGGTGEVVDLDGGIAKLDTYWKFKDIINESSKKYDHYIIYDANGTIAKFVNDAGFATFDGSPTDIDRFFMGGLSGTQGLDSNVTYIFERKFNDPMPTYSINFANEEEAPEVTGGILSLLPSPFGYIVGVLFGVVVIMIILTNYLPKCLAEFTGESEKEIKEIIAILIYIVIVIFIVVSLF